MSPGQDPDQTRDLEGADDEDPAEHGALLYIVRHGRAEDEHPLGDGARALTSEGREEFRALADKQARRIRLVRIATSPLVRATQTAEILAEASGVSDVVVRGELEGERATGRSVASLAKQLGVGWALVGHNPSLAAGLQLLLGLREEPRLRKGAIAALRPRDGGAWSLAWVVSPGKKRQREF